MSYNSYGDYFDEKQVKLDEQFEASRKTESNIFAGVLAAVDGFTEEISALEVKQILSRHGGMYAQYVWTPGITHLICSNLPTAKVRKELTVKRRKPVAIVTPRWIIDSLKAKRQLPWADYTLAQLHAPDQTTLNSWRSTTTTTTTTTKLTSVEEDDDIIEIDPSQTNATTANEPHQSFIRLVEAVSVLGSCLLDSSINQEDRDRIAVVSAFRGQPVLIGKSLSLGSVSDLVVGSVIPPHYYFQFRESLKAQLNETSLSKIEQEEHLQEQRIKFVEYDPVGSEQVHEICLVAFQKILPLGRTKSEMLNANEWLVEMAQSKESICWDTLQVKLNEQLSSLSKGTVSVELIPIKDPLSSWTLRRFDSNKDQILFDQLPCVPFQLASRVGSLPLDEAMIKLIEIGGEKERGIRKIISGTVRRKICDTLLLSVGQDSPKQQQQSSSAAVDGLSAHVRMWDNATISAESLVDRLLKRLMSRPAFRLMMIDSSSPQSFLLTISVSKRERRAAVSSSDLYHEAVEMMRELIGASTGCVSTSNATTVTTTMTSVKSNTKSQLVRMSLRPSSGLNPSTFSQISPQVLKQLPREVVRDLKKQFGRSSQLSNDDNGGPLMPETYSQLDVDTLKELPLEIRREVEGTLKTSKQQSKLVESLAQTPQQQHQSDKQSAIPTSASQIDPAVLAELPPDIQQSIERQFANGKQKKQQQQQKNEDDAGDKSKKKRTTKKKQTVVKFNLEKKLKDEEDDGELEIIEDMNSRSSFPETFSQIDMNTLRELPPEVAREIERDFKSRVPPPPSQQTTKKRGTLDSFGMKSATSKKFVQSNMVEIHDDDDKQNSSFSSKEVLDHEPFSKIHQTISKWLDSYEACPHETSDFLDRYHRYIEALLDAFELDTVSKVLRFLKRYCATKRCITHEGNEAGNDCWRFAHQDLERKVQRMFRERFDGSYLAWDV